MPRRLEVELRNASRARHQWRGNTSRPARCSVSSPFICAGGGTNIDSELRSLLRPTYNFRTAGRAFPKISRGGPQASAEYLSAIDIWHTFQAPTIAPGQRPLSNTWISGAMAFFLLRLMPSVKMIICVWRDPDDSVRLLDYSV